MTQETRTGCINKGGEIKDRPSVAKALMFVVP